MAKSACFGAFLIGLACIIAPLAADDIRDTAAKVDQLLREEVPFANAAKPPRTHRRRAIPPPRQPRHHRPPADARRSHRLRPRPGSRQAGEDRREAAGRSAVWRKLGPLLARCDHVSQDRGAAAVPRRHSARVVPGRSVQQEQALEPDRHRVHHRQWRRQRERRLRPDRRPARAAGRDRRPKSAAFFWACRFSVPSATTIRPTAGSASSFISWPRSSRAWPASPAAMARATMPPEITVAVTDDEPRLAFPRADEHATLRHARASHVRPQKPAVRRHADAAGAVRHRRQAADRHERRRPPRQPGQVDHGKRQPVFRQGLREPPVVGADRRRLL